MLTHKDDFKTTLCWALYDWANSAFATTVMAGFFPVFFRLFWDTGGDRNVTTARLGLANSAAGIAVALMAPVLGAIADRGTARKRFLMFFALTGAAMCASLYWVGQGHWLAALCVYAAATVGFYGGNIFYDSLLPAVASPKRMDWVSGLGYSLGYLGGALLFSLNVWMVQCPETFGLADRAVAIRTAFVGVGVWWAVFSIPILVFVREPANPDRVTGLAMVRAGLTQLTDTLGHIRGNRKVLVFLAAYWLYIDGVDTVIVMAVDYGLSIGLTEQVMIKALLITNFVGFPAAIAFGWLGTRWGARRGIMLGLLAYIAVVISSFFMHSAREFYVLALTIGLVQGGVQALSRSYYASLIPKDRSAEFFGFYNMLGKFAVVIGPTLVGTVGLLARHLGTTPDLASRLSIFSISLLFIGGGTLLALAGPSSGRAPGPEDRP